MSEHKDPAQSEPTPAEPTPAPETDGVAPAGEIQSRPGDNGVPPPAERAKEPEPAKQPKGGWLSTVFGRKPAAQPAAAADGTAQPKHHDVFREVAETVVFVVVLVLLLKTFIAEAFVIPTGSMATTLWGYQRVVTCPECGFSFPVNYSNEVDPPHPPPTQADVVRSCDCPNCRYHYRFFENDVVPPSYRFGEDANNGDRVLVSKFLYDSGLRKPMRYDVVVFKYPGNLDRRGKSDEDGPQKNNVAMNYIKRLIGLPGETVGIYLGQLYVAEGIPYPDDSAIPPEELRRASHKNYEPALEIFRRDVVLPNDDKTRKFHILRKSPDVLLALLRPVYDNDFQARDLASQNLPRWHAPQQGWKADNAEFPKQFTAEAGGSSPVNWLRYRNLVRQATNDSQVDPQPQPITDFMGYNTANQKATGANWVGDLVLEAEFQLDKAAKGDELSLELAKGVDRFQARFNLETGACTLVRLSKPDNKEQVLGQADTRTPLKAPGTYKVRFANVDERLTLWVNDQMPFGDGQVYDPAKPQGRDPETDPAKNNDLNPVGIGVKGAAGLRVAHLKLLRDTYYTSDVGDSGSYGTYFVQPKHYLCLGDNSPESSDGRAWGLVPDRLLLGRALVVYFPFKPLGSENRVGPIK